jgi:hypothetical protein
VVSSSSVNKSKIVLLFGCRAPVILRPRPEGGYTFVMGVYIHGKIDGEAYENLDSGKVQWIDIQLNMM